MDPTPRWIYEAKVLYRPVCSNKVPLSTTPTTPITVLGPDGFAAGKRRSNSNTKTVTPKSRKLFFAQVFGIRCVFAKKRRRVSSPKIAPKREEARGAVYFPRKPSLSPGVSSHTAVSLRRRPIDNTLPTQYNGEYVGITKLPFIGKMKLWLCSAQAVFGTGKNLIFNCSKIFPIQRYILYIYIYLLPSPELNARRKEGALFVFHCCCCKFSSAYCSFFSFSSSSASSHNPKAEKTEKTARRSLNCIFFLLVIFLFGKKI